MSCEDISSIDSGIIHGNEVPAASRLSGSEDSDKTHGSGVLVH